VDPGSTSPEGLQEYRAKRDFSATPEPTGSGHDRADERRFVVQHHRARRKHYDFRLEVDGVLTSWAMPKGPSMDPSARSLAVQVEDHPIEYRDFEGIIPQGNYGAGDVIVWDRGTYDPASATPDPARAILEGEIHFDVYGEKLRGRFVLVRTHRSSRDQEQWLMLHKRDEFGTPGWTPEDPPRSVKSGRTNAEVAAEPEAEWRSDLPAQEAEVRVSAAGDVAGPPPVDLPTSEELDALDSMGDGGLWELQGRTLKLTNLNKILFPPRGSEAPVSKRDLIRYYATMAPVMLPYLEQRPVNLNRFPNGVDRPGFWHKQLPGHAPQWISRWRNAEARPGESDRYAVVNDVATLAWIANFGGIELHPWTSRVSNVQEPTWALIDIDPGAHTTFEEVVLLARVFRSGLDHLGVLGLPKLTGRRGMHIWIPIDRGYTFEQTREWVAALSHAVGSALSELVSWTWEKRSREGKARLDFTQNARNKTLVAPYSVRGAPGAPVSVPIEWEELEDPDLGSDTWTIHTVPRRVAEAGDPFRRLLDQPQRLTPIS
jgi:bifunctional non-homologous end joining protein LigD